MISGNATYAQQNAYARPSKSTTREFIETAKFYRINRDWNVVAEFKSGYDEYVRFFPVEVINLKNNQKIKALGLDMYVLGMKKKKKKGFETAWIGLDEIQEFITFIEKHILPNLNLKFKKKSSKFIFHAKEMTMSYSVREKKRRLTIDMNNYHLVDGVGNTSSFNFWTETQIDKLPKLLEVLKKIK
ncbi:MAG TPA: hypothetical protein DCS93_23925 [Microscillaceae bacterium]|nr:hypothetical protein [Microscillaceae bacterium]